MKNLNKHLDALQTLKLGQVPRYVVNYLRQTPYKWQMDLAGNIIIKKGNPVRGMVAHMDFVEGHSYSSYVATHSYYGSTTYNNYTCSCEHYRTLHTDNKKCTCFGCKCIEFHAKHDYENKCSCGHYKSSHRDDSCLYINCYCKKFIEETSVAQTDNSKCDRCDHGKELHSNICLYHKCTCTYFVSKTETDKDICECSHTKARHARHGGVCYETTCNCRVFKAATQEQLKQMAKKEKYIGADDKVGVAIALAMLHEFPDLLVVLTEGEESGCVGANALDLSKLKRMEMLLECDRRTSSDIVTSISGRLCSREFEDEVMKLAAYTKRTVANGAPTDVGALRTRGVKANMLNISCGYYEPHSSDCYIIRDEVVATYVLARSLLAKLPAGMPAHNVEPIVVTKTPAITETRAKEDNKLLEAGEAGVVVHSDQQEVVASIHDPFSRHGVNLWVRAIKQANAWLAKMSSSVQKNSKTG